MARKMENMAKVSVTSLILLIIVLQGTCFGIQKPNQMPCCYVRGSLHPNQLNYSIINGKSHQYISNDCCASTTKLAKSSKNNSWRNVRRSEYLLSSVWRSVRRSEFNQNYAWRNIRQTEIIKRYSWRNVRQTKTGEFASRVAYSSRKFSNLPPAYITAVGNSCICLRRTLHQIDKIENYCRSISQQWDLDTFCDWRIVRRQENSEKSEEILRIYIIYNISMVGVLYAHTIYNISPHGVLCAIPSKENTPAGVCRSISKYRRPPNELNNKSITNKFFQLKTSGNEKFCIKGGEYYSLHHRKPH
ncbi:MAG: hypothetical protein LBC98_03505 [Prevotellaceae bacterium]|nr:hypothetical protein [Prevotellaceae bacterium]